MSKSLTKNSLYNVVYNGFTAFFPLITIAYISNILMAEGVGKVSYAFTIVSYFTVIAMLGIPQYGIKVIAKNYSLADRSKAFSELFLINFCSTVICIIAYYTLINVWDYFSGKQFLLNIMGIQLVLNIFNIDWFYQGIEEYQYITTRSITIKILSFVAMVCFVRESSDYIKYGLILCMATAGNNLLNVWHLKNKISFTVRGINARQHLKPIFILLASSLATQVYTMLDTVMIEHFHGDVFVGYYSNSVKIVRFVHTLSISLVVPFYPRISYYLKENENEKVDQLMSVGLKSILVICIPCVVGIELLADRIVAVLFGSSFMPAIMTLRILAPLIFVFSIAYFLGHTVLIATNNEAKILRATIVGAIVNFSINLFLIPQYKQNGAAVASVIAEIIVTLILITSSWSNYRLKFNKNSVFSIFVSAAVMSVFVFMVSSFMPINAFGLMFPVIAGVVSYAVFLIVLRNEIAWAIIHKVQMWLKKNQ